MKTFFAVAAFVAAVSAQNPPGCDSDRSGTFVINPIKIGVASKMLTKRQVKTICGSTPIVTIKGGVLTDQNGRTGEVVANSQFQFDNPIQTDSLFTSGFSICQNTSLAVGGTAIFYQCLNNPTPTKAAFNNLYLKNQGPQCNASYIETIFCDAPGGTGGSSSAASQPATSAPTTVATSSVAPTTLSTPAAPVITPVTTPASKPYPVGNTTAPVPSGTASGSTTTGTKSPSPSPFTPGSGASTLVLGGNVVALLVGMAAFAMF
ncbi:MAG: hypothetical protein LQ352_005126 [Teloschistes flavicans]|nr:MAG: hypothetical protein LQ352_005126 [Teloschistes flavicans]